MKWTDLFHSSEHLRVHHDLWRALTPALQQCEYRVRHDHGPVDGRWRMPGMPLAELIGAVDVRGPGHSGPALRSRAPEDGNGAIWAGQPIRDAEETCSAEQPDPLAHSDDALRPVHV